ncbi:TPA: hypothetical protein N0F65_000792 [Lagenidium giganteum]|uniref:protein-serine/threonine phosphatase n=1 Tax=Lagenidium giganteum TaxID=4803 RepID=A0AAV2ZL05_9STRA|nr:TPA: hypothetical protein N0F65_000792 [Lagenidium giganteum]
MALLSNAQKHRSLLLAKAHYHRAARRRHHGSFLMPLAASAMAASVHSQSSPVAHADAAFAGTPTHLRKQRDFDTALPNTCATGVISKQDPAAAAADAKANGETTNPWRSLLMTLYSLILPERPPQAMGVENDFLDDLKVSSVPEHICDVLQGEQHELFWRYDMDSYAANSHNEDRTQYVSDVITTDATGESSSVFFCACYDGHGGEEAVEFVHNNLYPNLRSHLEAGELSVGHAITKAFMDTDQEFNRRSRLKFEQGVWSACSVGACAVIALVYEKKLYVASCGDCRAIMAFREPDGSLSVEQITLDHSANEEREQRRLRVLHPDDYDIVREIGVNNYYVKGRLQPTRSIGDTYMKCKEVNKAPMPRGLRIHGSFKRPYITAVPDVFEIDLNDRQPEFLVLGSDGLYGEVNNEDIVNMVAEFRDKGVENVSMALRSAVLERVAKVYGFSASEMMQIRPGERRNYHDDITIDILHFSAPGEDTRDAEAA